MLLELIAAAAVFLDGKTERPPPFNTFLGTNEGKEENSCYEGGAGPSYLFHFKTIETHHFIRKIIFLNAKVIKEYKFLPKRPSTYSCQNLCDMSSDTPKPKCHL